MKMELKDGIRIIYLSDSAFSESAERFREDMESGMSPKDRRILLSLKDMNSINSSVMGEILKLYSKIKNKGGELIMTDAAGDLSELFYVTGVDKVIKVFKNEKEGLNYLINNSIGSQL